MSPHSGGKRAEEPQGGNLFSLGKGPWGEQSSPPLSFIMFSAVDTLPAGVLVRKGPAVLSLPSLGALSVSGKFLSFP